MGPTAAGLKLKSLSAVNPEILVNFAEKLHFCPVGHFY